MPDEIQKLRDAMRDALLRANQADMDHAEAAWLEYEASRQRFNQAIQREKERCGYTVHHEGVRHAIT